MKDKTLSTSIVLFDNDIGEITKTIDCALSSDLIGQIYLIDNSENDSLKSLMLLCSKRVTYFFQNANLGFGRAHNIALELSKLNGFKYHLILNPDVIFDINVISILINKLETDENIGLIMPKIVNEDGTNQFLPKLLPSPFKQLIRIIKPLRFVFKNKFNEFILKEYEDKELNVPIISGCFCIYSIKAYDEIGGYDDRFFMYYEDFDLSRRTHMKYKTLYYPKSVIIHGYERGAAKSFKLFIFFVKSAMKYYNKYGWLVDTKRKKINKKVINYANLNYDS